MKSIVVLALLAICACFVAAQENPVYEDGVLVLDDNNFEVALKEHHVLFVKFFAEWCGHCKKLAPEWVKAAKEVEGTSIKFAQVNVPDNRGVGSTYNVQGFPTLILDGVKQEYEGPREAAALVKFAKKYLEPAMYVANTKAEFDALFVEHPMLVAGYYENEKAAGFELFEKLAKSMRKDATFVHVKTYGIVSSPSNIAIYKADMEPTAYSGALELPDMQEFIRGNSFPLIDELGADNYMAYYKAGLPLTFTFVDPSKTDATEKAKAVLKAVAKKYIGKVLFTYTDGVKYRGQVDRMGLKAETFPSLSVQSGEMHYNFPQESEFTVENVDAWFARFVAGEMKPTIKSEPIPESQPGPVIKIVADTFAQIVLDPSKDVFVKFYAPWCGHCKHLAPIYEEMAQKLQQYPNIVIAEFDATANDVPVSDIKVQGFPTLYFFPADNKKGITYEGDRSLKDLLDFVSTHTTVTDFNMPKLEDSIPQAGKEEL